jgi:hypothetical protein
LIFFIRCPSFKKCIFAGLAICKYNPLIQDGSL